ncbi:dna polymerase beta domain-containing protein [Gloeomargarita lithophora Alchichica-D10]|uniref:Dna polymerase beta domain-containing protein n=1 Tax=Gloeomargarita lithophora Alchichica-D10 TaxID=1188229 RepID=A0A1J0AGJ8_9CYAN|nr:hypothetical protein [Gloeomargarita lithophora]APB35039.1 dna polymerase beta domain-containing protein [Gloeomargarita lithophora Alchichica-D10]
MIPQLEPPINQRIPASPAQIAEFCQRWHITEFALFGSVLRDDLRTEIPQNQVRGSAPATAILIALAWRSHTQLGLP